MRRALALAAGLLLTAGLAACGSSGTEDFAGARIVQRTVKAGEAEVTIELSLNKPKLVIPAATFSKDTIVIFADEPRGVDTAMLYFPTPAPHDVTDQLACLILNTPIDALFDKDLQVTFVLPATPVVAGGTQLILYRFDYGSDDPHWNVWGGTNATVSADGHTATATLPTTGLRGYVGSVALFNGMTADQAPDRATTIAGVVKDASDTPLASIDVAVFVMVGNTKYPTEIANADRRAPAGGTIENVIDTAADGSFTVEVPDNLVGQMVHLSFGFEAADYHAQDRFDILAPAKPATDAQALIVRFGANNVLPRPLTAGTD